MQKLLLFLALPFITQAQTSRPAPQPNVQSVVTLTCKKFVNCQPIDSMNLYDPVGMGYKIVQRSGRTADSSYIFKVPQGSPRFYAVGTTESASTFVILGEEPEVAMYGDCAKLEYSRAIGKLNLAYHATKKRLMAFQEGEQNAVTAWRMALNSGDVRNTQTARDLMIKIEAQKSAFLDSLTKVSPLLGKVAAIHLPPNAATLDKNAYPTDYEFLANEYFSGANLADPAYNNIPDLMEAFDRYARNLASMPAMAEQQKSWAQKMLDKLPTNSPAYRLALSGLVTGFQLTNSPNYLEFAKLYIETYKNKDNGEVRRLDYDLNKNRTFMPGTEVPDLEGMTPEGGTFSLKALRGKYVLIDFWASWCGPCRRENPNVRANYEQYSSKGFEILSVSLDRTLEAWKGAIAADGMTWKHISDLKGWQSEHAKMYSVTSIPQTLLIDPQGKLIVRNLRGEQLGETLRQIFGGK